MTTIEQVFDRVHKIGIILGMINSRIASGTMELEQEEALLNILEDYVWLTQDSVEKAKYILDQNKEENHEQA